MFCTSIYMFYIFYVAFLNADPALFYSASPFCPTGCSFEVTIVGGSEVIGGSKDAAVFRAFCVSNWSMTTIAAMLSTIGTALGTTHGSCLPLVANAPGVPSYCAVSWT